MILLALKKVGQKCIFHVKSSKEYWDHISSCYSGGSSSNECTVSLLKEFFFLSFKDTEPLQPQVNCCIYMAQQLETVGFPIVDSMLGFLLAMHLPESYSMLHTVITNADTSTITSKWVADHIIGEEKQHLRNFRGTTAIFYTKAGKGKGKLSQANSDNLKCFHFKKKGHKKSECHKLKKEKVEQEAAKNNSTTSSSSSGNSNSTSSSSTTTKITVTSDPPAYGTTNDLDIIRLFYAVAVPH